MEENPHIYLQFASFLSNIYCYKSLFLFLFSIGLLQNFVEARKENQLPSGLSELFHHSFLLNIFFFFFITKSFSKEVDQPALVYNRKVTSSSCYLHCTVHEEEHANFQPLPATVLHKSFSFFSLSSFFVLFLSQDFFKLHLQVCITSRESQGFLFS